MKKFRLLSSLLAVVMVLSMISVMPAGASQTGVEPFFCDFESFPLVDGTNSKATDNTFTAAGFTITGATNAVVDTDAEYGHTLGLIKNSLFQMDKELPTVTSGKVRIGFSYKLSAAGFSYVNGLASTNKQLLNLNSNGIVLMGPTNGKILVKSSTENIGKWFYVEIVVEPAEHTWTVYIDGVKKGSHTDSGLSDFKGIRFRSATTDGANTDARIDNLVISYEDANDTTARILDSKLVDNADGTKAVKVVFSEAIDALTANDVTVAKCGDSTSSLAVDSVDLNANNTVINLASGSSFDAGCEYIVKFADTVKALSGKSIDSETYLYQPLNGTVTTYTELKNFESLETKKATYTSKEVEYEYDAVTSEYAINILRNGSYYAGTANAEPRTVITTVDSTKVGTTQASGNAIGVNLYSNCRLLDIIPTDVGIETYEFDFTYTALGGNNLTLTHTTGTSSSSNPTAVTTALGSTGTWKHMRIDYDTNADTVSVYIDGVLNKKTEGITAFEHPLVFTHVQTGESLIGIDNYQSYVTVTAREKDNYDFNDLTYTDTTGRNLVNESYAKSVLRTSSHYADPSKEAYAVVANVDPAAVGNTSASGKALGAHIWTTMRLLDIIESDIGIETYEFDFLNTFALTLKHSSGESTTAGTQTEVSTSIATSNVWRHMRIDYNTETDELSIYIDGKLNKKTTSVTQFDHPLHFVSATSNVGFVMDNYTSYVALTGPIVEKVRYTDASGKVTGANNISPETTQIDITFSADVTAADVADISLTANGTDVDLNDPVIDGNIVTLNIPGMLPGNADIKLEIPADGRMYNVVTTAGKFEISDLDIKVNGAEVTEGGNTGENGAEVSVTAHVVNTKAQLQNLTVIYAFYYDDELVDVWSKDIDLNSTGYVFEITETDTSKANIDYDTVKVFVWDGLTTRTPLTVAASYPAN